MLIVKANIMSICVAVIWQKLTRHTGKRVLEGAVPLEKAEEKARRHAYRLHHVCHMSRTCNQITVEHSAENSSKTSCSHDLSIGRDLQESAPWCNQGHMDGREVTQVACQMQKLVHQWKELQTRREEASRSKLHYGSPARVQYLNQNIHHSKQTPHSSIWCQEYIYHM